MSEEKLRTPRDIAEEMATEQRAMKALKAQIKVMEDRYDVLAAEAKTVMETLGLDTIKAGKITVSLKPVTVPQVQDWLSFYEYISENDAFDMLQRRVSNAAWKARVDSGEEIPGVEKVKLSQVSFSDKT